MSKNPMPGVLVVLVVWMGIGVGLGVLSALSTGGVVPWVGPALNGALLIGVLRGNEAVRTLLLGCAFLGLALALLLVFLGFVALSQGGAVLLGGGLLAAAQNIFTLYCLRRQDVQTWMYKKSFPDID